MDVSQTRPRMVLGVALGCSGKSALTSLPQPPASIVDKALGVHTVHVLICTLPRRRGMPV
eukprot:6179106-Pleurochrysis_carterae.AAC.3